ncbi:hypothetical protein CTI12_AA269900 [Artemisia annua]|uniref:B3 domain-containing protein n=1 Tax=Artemisia annua TaxID=35608 RepID=A0A2U1NG67_ARTAN|nr:hypothetical protein CTI12_AA269900 [Artemisia annua]
MAAERVKTKSRRMRDLAASPSAAFTASTSQAKPQDSRTISELCYPHASAVYENNHNNTLADVDEDEDDDNDKYYMQERGVVNYAKEQFYFQKIQELVNRKFELFTRGELVLDDETDEEEDDTENKQRNKASSSKAVNKLKKKIKPISNDITKRLKEHITHEQNGTNIMLVIQKKLFKSDLAANQNRLTMPYNQLQTIDFLTEQEREYLLTAESNIDVSLLGPTLQMFTKKMKLVRWAINSTQSYILRTGWNNFVQENKNDLKQEAIIQVWSYRKVDHNNPCFAIAVVKRAD